MLETVFMYVCNLCPPSPHLRDVDAASRDVGRDEDLFVSGSESVYDGGSLFNRQFAAEHRHTVPFLAQLPRQPGGRLPRVAKYDALNKGIEKDEHEEEEEEEEEEEGKGGGETKVPSGSVEKNNKRREEELEEKEEEIEES